MCPSNSATPSPVNQPTVVNQPTAQTEIWTVENLAAFLKCSKRSVYELTRRRGQLHEISLPVLRLPCGMRFRRSDVEQWIQRCVDAAVEAGRVQ
jgi:predicted DNA-binding transcriptional regulator AlpA